MKPTELHVYDLDGTLYDSPRLAVDRPSWWYSAQSLQSFGLPGFDSKWLLGPVMAARRSIATPWVRTALLTGRPHHAEMLAVIHAMLRSADLPFDEVCLKPVWPPTTTPRYKSLRVVDWVADHPTANKVVVHDDLQENLDAVGYGLRYFRDMTYVPVLAPGVS